MNLDEKVACPRCGRPTYPDGSFCGHCGVRLLRSGSQAADPSQLTHATLATAANAGVCANCHEPLLSYDQFCIACGASRIKPPGVSASVPASSAAAWDRVLARLRTATAGEYQIQAEVGRGGMAAVYLARELALQRDVAIKVMSPGLLLDVAMVERFRREATTVASLRHPNIVSIYAVRDAEDLQYFVMEYIHGVPLDRLLRSRGRLTVPLVLAVLHQVASALQYAHRRGVVHRDVKPANIMLDDSGNAIVTDFGIAKVSAVDSHTQTGTSIGTPAYMSPEQCRGDSLTGASDQYSLGVVAFEMLTGNVPFTGPAYLVQTAHVQQEPPSVATLRADCPTELAQAVARMLAKRPADRWPSVLEGIETGGAKALTEADPVRRALADLVTDEVAPADAAALVEAPSRPIPVVVKRRPSEPAISPLPSVPPGFAESTPVVSPVGTDTSTMPWVRFLGVGAAVLVISAAAWLVVAKNGAAPVPPVLADRSVAVAPDSRPPPTPPPAPAVPDSTPLPAPTSALPAPAPVSPDLARLDIEGLPDSLTVGQAVRVLVVGRDRRGRRVAVERDWSSSDPSRASIDQHGQVAARAPGPVTIRARSGTRSAAAQVQVVAVAPVPAAPPGPPQPAPPPTDTAAASPPPNSLTASDAAIRRSLGGFIALLRERRINEIGVVCAPESEVDRRNLGGLQSLLRSKDYGAQVAETIFESANAAVGNRTLAAFRVRMAWTNSFGATRQEWVRFEAELERETDSWRIRRCRIVGSPRIG